MKRRARLTTLLIVLFGTVFLVSLAAVAGILIKSQQEERGFEQLAGTVAQETMPPAESTPVQSTPTQLPPAETEVPSPDAQRPVPPAAT